jgi:uncharacterized protein YbcC (UPF0753/DUF2309 family)
MILSTDCYDRIDEKFLNMDKKDRKKITNTKVLDAILQIDFYNEYGKIYGPQDILKKNIRKVQEDALECLEQTHQIYEYQFKMKTLDFEFDVENSAKLLELDED